MHGLNWSGTSEELAEIKVMWATERFKAIFRCPLAACKPGKVLVTVDGKPPSWKPC